MNKTFVILFLIASLVPAANSQADHHGSKPAVENTCLTLGPQTPRDISNGIGTNPISFEMAPAASELNLCNIHTHTNAEHKGPGFSVFVNNSDTGGYACNDTENLTAEELTNPYGTDAAYQGVKPGDTIEVHWVHSSCDVAPGPGLGSCLTEACTNPKLRVEAQVFMVVNDPNAHDFNNFDYGGVKDGVHQARSLPLSNDTVSFLGSTTGPSFNDMTCSPVQVTWNVEKSCKKVDIGSLHRWAAKGNRFEETRSQGVRQLVTDPKQLSPIAE